MPRINGARSLAQDPLHAPLLDKSGRTRSIQKLLFEHSSMTPVPRNDLLPDLPYTTVLIADLKLPKRRVRKLNDADVAEAANTIRQFGFSVPVIIGRDGVVIDGELRIAAAKKLGIDRVPCVHLKHLAPEEERALRLAINRLGQKRPYDLPEFKIELEELVVEQQPIELLGFSSIELDQVLGVAEPVEEEEEPTPIPDTAVNRVGDMWRMGTHLLLCGDSKDAASFSKLMAGEKAQLVLGDAPYNLKIAGLVSTEHREFVEGSGEMSKEEFSSFLAAILIHCHALLVDGGIALMFMDWRHISLLIAAGEKIGFELLNLICWVKSQPAMGSLWRSQHELIAAFKKLGTHKNNVKLGKSGRDRSNCWFAAGANTIGSEAREMLASHPTSKPPSLLVDAILDVTDRGDIVLDPFGGSGSTLIACEQAGRVARMIELDPVYCDLIVRRWSRMTGQTATLVDTGDSFEAVAKQRDDLLETIDAQ